MKILFLAEANLLAPRSVSYATLRLVESLHQMGHQVDVLSCDNRGHSSVAPSRQPTGAQLHSLHGWEAWSRLTWRCLAYPARRQIDVLHSVDATLCLTAFCSRWLGIPFVHAMFSSVTDSAIGRSNPLRAAAVHCERRAIGRCSGVLVHSRSLEDLVSRYSPHVPVIRTDWKYVHADTSPASNPSDIANPQTLTSVPHPRFLYLGSLARDQQVLLDAFVHYTCLPHSPGHLVMIGGSATEIRRVRSRVQRWGLQQRIHFLGQLEPLQVADELRRADILIAPALTGHHPTLKLYAYLAAQKPIVATNIAAHTQILSSATTRFVAPTAIDVAHGLHFLTTQMGSPQTTPYRPPTAVHEQESQRELELAKLSLFYDDIAEQCARRHSRTT